MPFSPAPHTPYQWQNAPATGTPLDSAHLEAAEVDLVNYVQQEATGLDSYLEGFLAPINSPTFTGVPSAPTPSGGDNSSKLATTAWVVANSPGGITGGTTVLGADTGIYGRTSTITAPVLRDFASLSDWAGASNGNGAFDDTAIFNTAFAAVAGAGGGTLIVPVQNPLYSTSSAATWTFQRILIATTSNVTLSMYGAQMQCVSAGAGSDMFKGSGNSTSAGTYITSGLRFFGGTVIGRGTESIDQAVVSLDRSTDCTVKDLHVTNWGSSGGGQVIGIYNSQRWRVLDNTLINCTGGGGGGPQNVINITTNSNFNGNSAVLQDGIISGNIITGTPAAAVALAFGNSADVQTLVFTVVGHPTGGTTQLIWTWGGHTYTSATIGFAATAAQVQTALLAATSTIGAPPLNSIVCYGGPAGGAAPYKPIIAVFQSNATGLVTGLDTNDAWTGGINSQTQWSYPPLRVSIRNNDLDSNGWTAIAMEIGGSPPAVYPMIDILISANVLRYSGPITNGCWGIGIGNDSSPPEDYQYLFRQILVAENVIHSNSSGMSVQGSDVTVGHNEITAYANGIVLESPNVTSAVNSISNVSVVGGAIHMVDSGLAGVGIYMVSVTDSVIDTEIYWDTGTTANSEGMELYNCQRIHIAVRITNAPLRAIRIQGNTGSIRIAAGTRILNPSSQTATNTSAIRFEGTFVENCWIEANVECRDNRGGSAAMNYAVDTSAATLGSYGVYCQGSQRFLGWTTSALNGTFATKGDDSIWDTTGVRYTQGKRVTYTTAAPSTGTWGQGDLAWNQTPSAAGTAFWSCTTGGSPGTWTPMNFGGGGVAAQTGLVRKGVSYGMSASDLGVIATVAGVTITLPTALTGASAALSYVVKNASGGSITVSTGSTGKIDNGVPGGISATSDTISTQSQANVYIPDTNVGSANYDWVRT